MDEQQMKKDEWFKEKETYTPTTIFKGKIKTGGKKKLNFVIIYYSLGFFLLFHFIHTQSFVCCGIRFFNLASGICLYFFFLLSLSIRLHDMRDMKYAEYEFFWDTGRETETDMKK